MAEHVDVLKFAGVSFARMPPRSVREIIQTCHAHGAEVSTGVFLECVLTQGPGGVARYPGACRGLGFDIVEVSSGSVTLPADDLVRLVRKVLAAGLKPKPEVGVQFGAGGATATAALELEGTQDPGRATAPARRYLDAGAAPVRIESKGITESVSCWRTEVVARKRRPRATRRDVRSPRSASVCPVSQVLRAGREPLRGSQSDRPTGVPAGRHLGNQQPPGPGACVLGPRFRVTESLPAHKLVWMTAPALARSARFQPCSGAGIAGSSPVPEPRSLPGTMDVSSSPRPRAGHPRRLLLIAAAGLAAIAIALVLLPTLRVQRLV